MPPMLIHDDDRCRDTEGVISDISSTLCRTDADDIEPLISTMLPQIAGVVAADAVMLTATDASGEKRTFRYALPRAGDAGEDEASTERSTVWDYLDAGNNTWILERIPGDIPAGMLTPALLDYLRAFPIQTALSVPVAVADATCALAFECFQLRTWSAAMVSRLRLCAEVLAAGWLRRWQTLALREVRHDAPPVTEASSFEPRARQGFPRSRSASAERSSEIVGDSPALRAALGRIHEVAPTRSTVLLLGETGTGKELFAKAIHDHSPRRSNPFVVVNCAALPPSLIESELFGHTRGAFTGAVTTRHGRFELAHRGTLFLDEIGDLPLDLATKLLRVLQEGAFERLGSSQTQSVDVRIIAATHRDLRRMISDGTFREDLYYRLSVFPIRLPALRERREDIPKLVWYIIQKNQELSDHRIRHVPPHVMEQLQQRAWSGNVRELENVIQGALIHSAGDVLTLLDDTAEPDPTAAENGTALSAVERAHIQEVLRACGWRINGAGNAAERLGLHPNTLRFRMKKLGIVREHASRPMHIASA